LKWAIAKRHEVRMDGTHVSEDSAGNTMVYIFPLSVFLVYLVLPLNMRSWSLPLVVILIVPMTLFSAIAGVWLLHGDNTSSHKSV